MNDSNASPQGHDGIDETVWSRLSAIAQAAKEADAVSYATMILHWADDFPIPGQHRMGVYLMYLLGFRIKEMLRENKPTDADLHNVALTTHPLVNEVLDKATVTQLEETARIAFDRPTLSSAIAPAEFVIFAGAMLGVLLDDSAADLARIRPRLASWWQRHYENFRAQGLTDYPADR